MANTNILEGVKCPKCGHDKSFYIDCSSTFLAEDDGIEQTGDTIYDQDSFTECNGEACDFSGPLRDFYS